MIGAYALIAVALAIMGAVAALLVLLAAGIHREEKARSLTSDSPGPVTSGVRAATGVFSRGLKVS
jgi:hypothetical protein